MNAFSNLENSLKLRPIRTAVQIPAPLEPKPPHTAEGAYPWIKQVARDCSECGGSGYDSTANDPFGDICKRCMGSQIEMGTRNYLAEAFELIRNPNSFTVPEREHLVAIVQFLNKTVNDAHENLGALKLFLPEVA